MIRLILLSICLLTSLGTQSQSFDWAIGIGGDDFDDGRAIITDTEGNIYVSGKFDKTVDFDPSDSEFLLNSGGNTDSYVAKYSSTGKFIWVRHFNGSTSSENLVADMVIDSDGHLILVGEFTNSTDFDPLNPGGDYRASSRDGYVIKMTADGELVWVQHMKGIGEFEIRSVCVDEENNIYHTGHFYHSQNFNLGDQESYEAPNNRHDLYVQKLDPEGQSQWIHHPYGDFFEAGKDVMAHNGSVYLVGYFEGSVDFDPGIGTATLTSIENNDAFIQKLSSEGEHQWASSWGGESLDDATNVLIDPDGKIQVVGDYLGECYFTDNVILPKVIGGSGYILTILENGKWERVRQTLEPNKAVYDQSGHLYIGLNNSILKYDLEGKIMDQFEFEKLSGTGFNEIKDITIGPDNDLIVTGQFFDEIDFDPSETQQIFTSNKWSDMFIVKLSNSTTPIRHLQIDHTLSVAPNPFDNYFSIQSDLLFGNSQIRLLDQMGRVVFQKEIPFHNGQIIQIPSTLPSGFYVLSIINQNHTGSIKLVRH